MFLISGFQFSAQTVFNEGWGHSTQNDKCATEATGCVAQCSFQSRSSSVLGRMDRQWPKGTNSKGISPTIVVSGPGRHGVCLCQCHRTWWGKHSVCGIAADGVHACRRASCIAVSWTFWRKGRRSKESTEARRVQKRVVSTSSRAELMSWVIVPRMNVELVLSTRYFGT